MRAKLHVKKGDQVAVIAGKDKGRTGEVISIDRKALRVCVKGVNLLTKHKKATQTEQGGIVRVEGSVHVSNVQHMDPKDKKVTRIGFRMQEDGKKVRFSRRSGEVLGK